jgi:hypothetical protein
VLSLRKIKQQTELQTRSIELQERTMPQWVDYGSWNSHREVQEGGRRIRDAQMPRVLRVARSSRQRPLGGWFAKLATSRNFGFTP